MSITKAERVAIFVALLFILYLLAQIASNTAAPGEQPCFKYTPDGTVPCVITP